MLWSFLHIERNAYFFPSLFVMICIRNNIAEPIFSNQIFDSVWFSRYLFYWSQSIECNQYIHIFSHVHVIEINITSHRSTLNIWFSLKWQQHPKKNKLHRIQFYPRYSYKRHNNCSGKILFDLCVDFFTVRFLLLLLLFCFFYFRWMNGRVVFLQLALFDIIDDGPCHTFDFRWIHHVKHVHVE